MSPYRPSASIEEFARLILAAPSSVSRDAIIIALDTGGGGSRKGPTEIGISLLDTRIFNGPLQSHQHIISTYNYTLRFCKGAKRAPKRVRSGEAYRTARAHIPDLLYQMFHYSDPPEDHIASCGCQNFRPFGVPKEALPPTPTSTDYAGRSHSRPVILLGQDLKHDINALSQLGWHMENVSLASVLDTQQIAMERRFGDSITLSSLLRRLNISVTKMQLHTSANDAQFTLMAALHLAADETGGKKKHKILDIIKIVSDSNTQSKAGANDQSKVQMTVIWLGITNL